MSIDHRPLIYQAYLYTLAFALLAVGGISLLDVLLQQQPSPYRMLLLPDSALLALTLGATLLAAVLRQRRACLLACASILLLMSYTLLYNSLYGGAEPGRSLLGDSPRLHSEPVLLLGLLAVVLLAGCLDGRLARRLGELAGALVMALGLLGLLARIWPALTTPVLGFMLKVPTLSGLTLILLGLAVLLLNRLSTLPGLAPFDRRTLLAGVCGVLLSTASWALLSQQSINALTEQSQLLLERLQSTNQETLSARLALIQRMAERWQASASMPSDLLWQQETGSYLRDFPNLGLLAVLDERLVPQRSQVRAPMAQRWLESFLADPALRDWLQQVRAGRKAQMSASLNLLGNGPMALIAAPLHLPGQQAQLLVASLDVGDTLGSLLGGNIGEFIIRVHEGGQLIYDSAGTRPAPVLIPVGSGQARLAQTPEWTIGTYLEPGRGQAGSRLLAILVLLAGLALSFFLMFTQRLAWGAQQQALHLRERQRFDEAQSRVLDMISTLQPLPQILESICRLIEQRDPRLRCSILLVDSSGQRLTQGAAPSLPEHYNQAVNGLPIREGTGSCGTAAFRRQAVLVNDIAHDPLWQGFHELAASSNLHACWSTPLFAACGELLGTFAIYQQQAMVVDTALEDLVATASHLAAIAIEHKTTRQRLQESEQRFRSLFACNPDPVFAFDLRGCFERVNPVASQLLGYREDELLGAHFTQYLAPTEAQRIQPLLLKVARGETHAFELQCHNRAGELLELDVTQLPIVIDRAIVGVFCIAKDIRQRKSAERTLQSTLAELERSNRELQEFAFVASHDLQEPLRKIQTFAERLRTRPAGLDEQGRDYLQRMSSAAERMQALIHDLLAYSRVATRTQPFVRLHLERVLDAVLQDLEHVVERSGAQIVRAPLPAIVGDPSQMRQLLQNLLSNAIKFHKPGELPQVRIYAEHQPTGEWSLCVSDQGVGFDEKYLDRIFHPFQRLHSRQEYPGTGIGLAIVNKIAERHGARLSASSQPGQGATFRVTFPAADKE
ncbi:ATP-binding protein [Geopseudomonas aromaticivorans]